jgi:hypothetical protein
MDKPRDFVFQGQWFALAWIFVAFVTAAGTRDHQILIAQFYN